MLLLNELPFFIGSFDRELHHFFWETFLAHGPDFEKLGFFGL